MKKFMVINFRAIDPNCNEVPYLWLTLKSYFNRNSMDPTAWLWLDPLYSSEASSEDDIIQNIIEQKPDVIGISCYMWNDKLTLHIAEMVKQSLPEVKIIAGGPALYYEHDMAWFKKFWYIDAVCEYNGYGEVFITDYLDGKQLNDIPFNIYPSKGRTHWIRSTATINKRSFKYPMPYLDNIDYLQRFPKTNVKVILDTSRGCPYSCSFCEWGGGTNSKVAFKSKESINAELDVMFFHLKPAYIDIINANFGIVKDDVETTEKIVEFNEKYHCVKFVNMYGPTKTSKQNLKKIFDLLLAGKMLDDIKISVQHTDQNILNNIKRVDVSFDDQLDLFSDLCHKYDYPLRVETMIGLPGETLDTFYQLTDDVTKSPLVKPLMHEWMMLPSAPAADPSYSQSMQIKTKKVRYHIDSYDRHILPKNFKFENSGYRSLLLDQKWLEPYDVVVSTYSYSKKDWVQMELFKYYFTFLNATRVLTPFVKYLRKNGHSIKEFHQKLFNEFLMNLDAVKKSHKQLIEGMDKDEPLDIFYADLAPNLPYISHYSVLKFMILLDADGFFKNFLSFLTKTYGEDEYLKKLCAHLSENIKTPMKMDLPTNQKISQCLSMCRFWGDDLFLDDFTPKYE